MLEALKMNYPIDKLHLLTLHVGLANHNGDVEVSACSTDLELIQYRESHFKL